jgi:hypothetical protein
VGSDGTVFTDRPSAGTCAGDLRARIVLIRPCPSSVILGVSREDDGRVDATGGPFPTTLRKGTWPGTCEYSRKTKTATESALLPSSASLDDVLADIPSLANAFRRLQRCIFWLALAGGGREFLVDICCRASRLRERLKKTAEMWS